jgi:hypothetical protein
MGKEGQLSMDGNKTTPTDPGTGRRSACLYGCLVAVGIVVILSAVGVWTAYRTAGGALRALERLEAEGEAALPPGVTLQEATLVWEEFIDGLMYGSIRPETGASILSRLFLDASDGVLTREEIGSILEQMRRARGMNL